MDSKKKTFSSEKKQPIEIAVGHTFGFLRFILSLIISIGMIIGGFYLISYSNRYISIKSTIHEKNILSDVTDSCNASEKIVTCLGIVYNYNNKTFLQKTRVTDHNTISYEIGGSLSIYIDPKNPDDFMVVSKSTRRTLHFSLILGIILIILGILIMMISIMRIYLIFHYTNFAEHVAYYNVAV